MTAAEGSYLGFAKQTAYETPNTTDAAFKYVLFREGAFGVNNIFLPLDPEIGGGALQRYIVKAGVNSGGALNFIPRPETLGFFLYGVTGKVATTGTDPYDHVFTLNTDQFSAPYYTGRYAPGNMWGEQLQDLRFNMLSLEWRGANFISGSVGAVGGLPAKVSTAAWSASTYVDSGPPFLAPVSDIELPTGADVSVLSGAFIAQAAIPLDEQYVVGSYVPEGLDIVSKQYAVTMAVKVSDATLYTKMMYDPAAGSAWAADIFKEADIKLEFNTDQANYQLVIAANGQSNDDANVFWSAQVLGLRAQRQVVMNITGTFLASPTADEPIEITLTNHRATY